MLLFESRVETSQPVQRAWVPLNTLPTPTRHGEIEASLPVVNNNPVGAALRFGLYGMDGTEIDRYELIVRERSQREYSLVELFNVGQFKGTLRIFSDAPVSVHAEQETVNLRREAIAMQLPVFEAGEGGEETMLAVIDGDSIATEIAMVNTGGEVVEGQNSLRTAEGEPSSLPLR